MDEQHIDSGAEFSRRFSQALSAGASLLEAIERARYYRRSGDRPVTSQDGPTDLLTERAEAGRVREAIDRATDPDWLAEASLDELARAWGTARTNEGHIEGATEAREHVEAQLRQTEPDLMAAYDTARAAGAEPDQAMADAVERTFAPDPGPAQHARPHPGRGGQSAITTGTDSPDTGPTEPHPGPTPPPDLTALREQLIDLGPAGQHAAELADDYADAAWSQTLQAQGDQGRADAHVDLGIDDHPATPTVDEHTVERDQHVGEFGQANTRSATADAIDPHRAFYSQSTGGQAPTWIETTTARPARTLPPGPSTGHTRSHAAPKHSRG